MEATRNENGSSRYFCGPPHRVDKKQSALRFIEVTKGVPGLEQLADNKDWRAKVMSFFASMPKQYVMDISIESPTTVIKHMELIDKCAAGEDFAFDVKELTSEPNDIDMTDDEGEVLPLGNGSGTLSKSFSSSPNLVALHDLCMDDAANGSSSPVRYEITVAARDKAKVLATIFGAFSELSLNILEAHAFSGQTGIALDVFVVSGWNKSATDLEQALVDVKLSTPKKRNEQISMLEEVITKTPEQIDLASLDIGDRFSSGSYGDLHLGKYNTRNVAVKIIRTTNINEATIKEFDHEVRMMHQLQHINIVEFIGSCVTTKDMMIVSEYMEGGNLYNYLRKTNGGSGLKISTVLSFSKMIASGLEYLHKKSIIHRDLKTANLLLSKDFSVLKIGDFGVARMVEANQDMTAETGTYRWMAPEVIQHQFYNTKADVYSFAICIWEMLTAQNPYTHLSPIQAAMQVVEKDLRPKIPSRTPSEFASLIRNCWDKDHNARPSVEGAIVVLDSLTLRETNSNVVKTGSWFSFTSGRKGRVS